MRRFRVIVNGREYIVEVDEISGSPHGLKVVEQTGTVGAEQVEAPDSQFAQPLSSVSADSKTIEAPLAGSILSVLVKPGDHVSAGDIVLTLEALKLENEITTPYSGVVRSVAVTVGQNVSAGDVLVVIDET